ncbi:MAG: hypothetical protein ACRDV4_05095 [Acidimicrobiales bacterium]
MLSLTDQAESVISLMVELDPKASGVRLSGSLGDRVGPPAVRLVMAYAFTVEDELVMTQRGVPVFIDPEVVPVLKGTTLHGSVDTSGRPRFTAWRDELHMPWSSD